MPTEENKAIVRRYVQEVVNEGKIELVDSLFSTDLAFHLPHLHGPLRGREIFKQLIGQTRIVFRSRSGQGFHSGDIPRLVPRCPIVGLEDCGWRSADRPDPRNDPLPDRAQKDRRGVGRRKLP